MSDDRLHAAVASGVLASEAAHRALLVSIVEVARAIFGARAASILLHDTASDELVFEAVAGGDDHLLGVRFPSSTGVAGWVLVMRQPLVLDDVAKDDRFSREAAEATGYVPQGLMAVPLLVEDRALGVLEVLDRHSGRFTLAEMDLLGLFAGQAAIALDLLQHARHARAVLAAEGGDARVVARLAGAVDRLPAERRAAGMQLLAALADLLGAA